MMEIRELGMLKTLYEYYLDESMEQDEARTQLLWLEKNGLLDEEKVKKFNAENFYKVKKLYN